jgi:hypothetical protein
VPQLPSLYLLLRQSPIVQRPTTLVLRVRRRQPSRLKFVFPRSCPEFIMSRYPSAPHTSLLTASSPQCLLSLLSSLQLHVSPLPTPSHLLGLTSCVPTPASSFPEAPIQLVSLLDISPLLISQLPHWLMKHYPVTLVPVASTPPGDQTSLCRRRGVRQDTSRWQRRLPHQDRPTNTATPPELPQSRRQLAAHRPLRLSSSARS